VFRPYLTLTSTLIRGHVLPGVLFCLQVLMLSEDALLDEQLVLLHT
jgi:hypothetical protein